VNSQQNSGTVMLIVVMVIVAGEMDGGCCGCPCHERTDRMYYKNHSC